jgi:hypothetical protein
LVPFPDKVQNQNRAQRHGFSRAEIAESRTVRYKDTEVPCAVCGNALPFTRFVVNDNKLVDSACKQCWK